jgi:hypothetical protein
MRAGALEHIKERHQQEHDDDPEGEIAKVVHGRPFMASRARRWRGPVLSQIGTV